MFFRAVTLVAGLACAAGLSQFPEYSQQYTQRLAGAVDALSEVVASFDADAEALGMTRYEALADLSASGAMAKARAASMQQVFARHEKLSSDLRTLQTKAPVSKLAEIWRMTDRDVAQKAWADFKPAIPVSTEAAGFGLLGFMIAVVVLSVLRGSMRLMFGRRAATA